jgi:cyclopropane-fatty-acyl-phospholipid synthase
MTMTSPSVATRLAAALRDAAGIDLPVRLRAWDGSAAGPEAGPTVVIRNRRALRRLLWSPGELGLVGGSVSFEDGRMGVDQIVAVRPTTSGESGMPAGRPWAITVEP